MKPMAYSIGVSHEIEPLYIVAVQLKTLIGRRDGDEEAQEREDQRGVHRLARDEHVVAPDQEAEHGDAEARERDERVAEDLLAAEGGDELADDAHRRQDHDVDGRVRVEPEQVLEQHRVAAERRIEDAEVEQALGRDQEQRDGETGVPSTMIRLVA